MPWAVLQYDRRSVNAAGRALIADEGSITIDERNQALEVINNWRSSHSYPLQCLKMTLSKRARKVDEKAIVAQRLKRLPSIDAKLRQHSDWMKLTNMQDIGGCRTIVRSVKSVETIVQQYREAISKSPKKGHVFVKENDYISSPKDDGYRSHHFVFAYRSLLPKRTVYNGLKIEIQIRTRLQHAWATAVETVAAFKGQALKSRGGERDWRRFFALMSAAIAVREKKPIVPLTPLVYAEVVDELASLNERLNVVTVLEGWRTSIREITSRVDPNTIAYLLKLDPEQQEIRFRSYTADEMAQASEDYLSAEKEMDVSATSGSQAVLVAVGSLHALRKAFPNYYLDTTVFVEALRYALKPAKKQRVIPFPD